MKQNTLELFLEEQKRALEQVKNNEKAPKTYKHEEVLKSATAYFNGDKLAAEVWMNKYALRDRAGNLYEKSPHDMHVRLTREISRIEKSYPNPIPETKIFELLERFKYIVPQGGPMSGIGNEHQITSLSNCFVIGSGSSDSYGGIMKTDEEQVQLMKRRGGVGHDLSHLRPAGASVNNSALSSTGVVSFMERYSNSTREVAQGGRRGALMLSLSVKHPDIEQFITAKNDRSKITGANVSIRINDEFMKAVAEDKPFNLQYPIDSPEPQQSVSIEAKKLWEKIIDSAWSSAEPGILFWDTITRESIPDCYADLGFETTSTNPCGEIPLCPYDSCRLMALNLYSYVNDPFHAKAEFDFELFRDHVGLAQKMMDDIVDLEIEKIDNIIRKIEMDPEDESIKHTELTLWKKIRQKCIDGRRMGIGITGEGDMLAALNLRYGSEEAINFSTDVHKTLAVEAYRGSVNLARERSPFPLFSSNREKDNPFILRLKETDPDLYNDMVTYGRRNIALLTIAPTGTTSLMTQTTSGIEPVFRISYTRRRKANENEASEIVDEVGDRWIETRVFHHAFKDYLYAMGLEDEQIENLQENELNQLIASSPYNKSTAGDIDWVQKVKMQGRIQKWVDHSISVTVNLPEETTQDIVSDIYLTAWKAGCKGITIYREGSRSGVLISDDKKSKNVEYIQETDAPKRPSKLDAKILRFMNNKEKWIAVVGLLNDRPYEIFTGKAEDSFAILSTVDHGWVIKNRTEEGKSRYDFQYKDREGYRITIEGLSRTFNEEYWNYAKLISGVLRHGMPLKFAVHLVGNLNLNDEHLNTWKNGVTRALTKFIADGTEPIEKACPECDNDSLQYQEGCLSCVECGYTKCG